METTIKILLAVNSLCIAFALGRLLFAPLKFEQETKPNYNEEVDWLLSLDEAEVKISE